MDKQAVIVVDMQNDYFPEGKFPLVGIKEAAANAAKVIAAAREKGHLVIHVRHEMSNPNAPFFIPGTDGAQINEMVKPIKGEPLIVKHHPNSFRDTPLRRTLDEHSIHAVTIVGAMSHMCINATVRAAADFGYRTTTIHDACATRDLEFNGTIVPAAQVHTAMMAALSFAYGTVLDTAAWTAG